LYTKRRGRINIGLKNWGCHFVKEDKGNYLCFFFIRRKKRKEVIIRKVRLVCEKDREVESIIETRKRGNLKNLVCETVIDIKIERTLQMILWARKRRRLRRDKERIFLASSP
jgi:hypothetical protein